MKNNNNNNTAVTLRLLAVVTTLLFTLSVALSPDYSQNVSYPFVKCEGDTNTYPEGTECDERSDDWTKEDDERQHQEESEEWDRQNNEAED